MACLGISGCAVVSWGLRAASYRVHGRSDEYDLLLLVDARVRVPGADDGGEEVVGHAVDDLCWALSTWPLGNSRRLLRCLPWPGYLR